MDSEERAPGFLEEPPEGSGRLVEREILRVVGELETRPAVAAAALARREALKWARKRMSADLPSEAWAGGGFEMTEGGRHCSAVRLTDERRDLWAFRAEDKERRAPGRVWTTELLIAHHAEGGAHLTGRLLAASPGRRREIGPASPSLFREIQAVCGLTSGGVALPLGPMLVETEAQADELMAWMTDRRRRIPLCVFSEAEPGAPQVDPAELTALAHKLFGIGGIVRLSAAQSWRLRERFGKRLAVFGGAARFYMPGFDEEADPFGEHRLFQAAALRQTGGLRRIATIFGRLAATESLKRLRMGRDLLSYAEIEGRIAGKRLEARTQDPDSNDSERLSAAREEIEALRKALEDARAEAAFYLEEQHAAERKAREAEAAARTLEERNDGLKRRLAKLLGAPEPAIPLPEKWSQFGDWCDQHLADQIILTPQARREVKAPLFRDVGLAAQCLLWLAEEYWDARMNGSGGDLRGPIVNGVKNDGCGGDGFSFIWGKRRINVDWHIKNGGNTRDPERCLRIYYFWDDEAEKVVVVSMPAHRKNSIS